MKKYYYWPYFRRNWIEPDHLKPYWEVVLPMRGGFKHIYCRNFFIALLVKLHVI